MENLGINHALNEIGIVFDKYNTMGPYHWNVLSHNIFKRNILFKARYEICANLLKKELDGVRKKRILDIGCGDGVLSFLLHKEGAEVCGIDSSVLAVSIAAEQHNKYGSSVKFKVMDACNTQFPDSSFDGVIASELIEHVDDPKSLLLEIKRILKPNGFCVVSTPVRLAHKPLDAYHYQEWFPEDLEIFIESIFPNSKYSFSHPIFWTEFFYHSKLHRLLLQTLSLFINPLKINKGWLFFRQQYVIIKKQ